MSVRLPPTLIAASLSVAILAVAIGGSGPRPAAAVPGACPSFGDPVLVSSNMGYWDFAFDNTCQHLFAVSPGYNQVQVLNLQTLAFEAPIAVGTFPSSLDITPDGSTLYVTNGWAPNISVVDVATRHELRKINVPPGPFNDYPYSIAIANNGKAIFSTAPSPGYYGRLMQLDLATDAVSARSEASLAGTTTQGTRLVASADRSHIGVAFGGDSSGPVSVYSAATDSFTPMRLVHDYANRIAADTAGDRFLVAPNSPGYAYLLDSQANLLGTITGSGNSLGIALDTTGHTGYRADNAGIHILNMTTLLEVGMIPLTGFQAGNMVLSPDGQFLAVDTNGMGMWIVPVNSGRSVVVNDAGDSADASPGDGQCDTGAGVCTLRAAIQETNATPGKDLITFSIGTGQQTITPTTPLPAIADPVEINGTTQPFFSDLPLIILDGTAVGGTSPGLFVTSGGSKIRGLRISNFTGAPGIELAGGGSNVVSQNFIGVNGIGSAPQSNLDGILISASDNNLIGGTTAQSQNLISGNTGDGILIEGSSGNVVRGNIIGLNRAGQTPVPNNDGVHIIDSSSTTIGGLTSGAGNTISGNTNGVVVEGGASTGNLLQGNKIGVMQNGGYVAPNTGNGVLLSGVSANTIGGAVAGAGNTIANSGQEGVHLLNSSNNILLGNQIGGTGLGNTSHGILIDTTGGSSSDNVIGGLASSAGNLIANNGGDGVRIVGPQALRNTIRGNAIAINGGTGIHNMSGGNGEIAVPLVTGMAPPRGTALPGCLVDLYSADAPGEGANLQGTALGDGSGNWSFAGPVQGWKIAATCVDASGNTSEFSNPCDLSDLDCDGVLNASDTCPEVANPAQTDTDGDGRGDACEVPGTGNIDCNQAINSIDSLVLLRYKAGLSVIRQSPCAPINGVYGAGLIMGDVNCNGIVNSADALVTLRAVAGLSLTLPPGCPAVKP